MSGGESYNPECLLMSSPPFAASQDRFGPSLRERKIGVALLIVQGVHPFTTSKSQTEASFAMKSMTGSAMQQQRRNSASGPFSCAPPTPNFLSPRAGTRWSFVRGDWRLQRKGHDVDLMLAPKRTQHGWKRGSFAVGETACNNEEREGGDLMVLCNDVPRPYERSARAQEGSSRRVLYLFVVKAWTLDFSAAASCI